VAASDLLAGAVKSSEDSADMTSEPTQHYYANVVLLEKQPEATHYSNTRMSGGGFHSG